MGLALLVSSSIHAQTVYSLGPGKYTGRAEVNQRYKRRTRAMRNLRVKGLFIIFFFLPFSLCVRPIHLEFQLYVKW